MVFDLREPAFFKILYPDLVVLDYLLQLRVLLRYIS